MKEKTKAESWRIYRGDGLARTDVEMPDPPPWRDFARIDEHRAKTFRPPEGVVEMVNAALRLARPILVTGDPGTGKSSLAYSIARELDLGGVLVWPIHSRSTLQEGLYQYDALARLRDAQLTADQGPREEDLGRYLRLGPLGTALASDRPRVVLVDEIDKSDVDLPGDLLHVLEEGRFDIPELRRIADRRSNVEIGTSDPGARGASVPIVDGEVRARRFPVIVMTSNGERDLPPAFLRRCVRVDVPRPSRAELERIALEHLPERDRDLLDDLLANFEARREKAVLATDQLLNAFFLLSEVGPISADERRVLLEGVLRELSAR